MFDDVVRTFARVAVVAVIGAACTGSRAPAPTATAPSASPSTVTSPPIAPITLDVVAATSPSALEFVGQQPYLAGMRAAVEVVNAAGGIGGRPLELTILDEGNEPIQATAAIGRALLQRPAAILYVGPGPALRPLRLRFAAAGTPVVLLEGDLYTSHGLFRQSFQTTIPWQWQVQVIARYLVRDRRAGRIVFVGFGPEAESAGAATNIAVDYWGGRLSNSITVPAGGSISDARLGDVASADAVVDFGSPEDSRRLIEMLQATGRVPRIAGSENLLTGLPNLPPAPPGATACYTYTWGGWAQPVPRVGAFIRTIQRTDGHPPSGLEQEGFDAVRALADGLRATGGRGGGALTSALERIHDRFYSSFPVFFGPDDHEFLPRDELGLFALTGPGERIDPWQSPGPEVWRPIMRTFTYDGRRDNILPGDRPVFFPFWRKNLPGPYYWRSRYGIVSGPNDPRH